MRTYSARIYVCADTVLPSELRDRCDWWTWAREWENENRDATDPCPQCGRRVVYREDDVE